VRVGEEVQNLTVKLVHRRAIFGPITGESGVRWQPDRPR
jgi:hypothetical protein